MRILLGMLLGVLLVALAAAAVVATGAWNVAATTPAGKLEQKLAGYALDRAVARRAPSAANPVAASRASISSGLAHYRENCVVCHGGPGVDGSELAAGLNPAAPDLTLPRVQRRSDGEMFWIVTNGIRMTGMPGFGPTHEPEEIWKIVAFLRHLPQLTPEEEAALRPVQEASEHHDADDRKASPAGAVPTPHSHPPGSRPHRD